MDLVNISTSINDSLKAFLKTKSYSTIAVLVDENTKHYCYPILDLPNHSLIEISSGELNKTLATCSIIWQQLTELKFDRNSLLINLGGGVIGDMGGFCARTYKRGIDFINIPTTLLSQVDASVGGKLGIDFNGFKNHIGLFSEPDKVLIDPVFLSTLPQEELYSGFAEVIKHHLIADGVGWSSLRVTPFDQLAWKSIITHSVKIKSTITTSDFKESGLRKSLNFGHTIGHAIESYFLESNDRLLHGEAIAIGMICEAEISFQRNMLSEHELNEITELIKKLYKKILIDKKLYDPIIELMKHDKKNNEASIKCVLLNNIGHTVWDQNISESEIKNSIDYYNQI